MNTWWKFLLLVAVLGAAVADEGQEAGNKCESDGPGLTDSDRRNVIMRQVQPCFKPHMDDAKLNELRESPNLENFRNLFKEFCPHVQEVTTCMAGVRNSLANCEIKNVTASFMLLSELAEHVITTGCENDGDRLAHIARGVFLIAKRTDTLVPLRHCVTKAFAFLKIQDHRDIDLASESYLFYHQFAKLKKCMIHVEDETYKPAAQWLLDEVAAAMKCKHPEEDTMVLCSDIDVTKVTISSICQLETLKSDHLYDDLEGNAEYQCILSTAFDHDNYVNTSYSTNLEFLKDDYKRICKDHRELPNCLLEISSYGESCLPQEENKQFQLVIQVLHDYMSRLCVEDGAFLADVMLEVYKNTAEHGNAMRDCYNAIIEEAKTNNTHALSTKTMRFYHEVAAYKKCVVQKLQATRDLASNLETAIDDVMKKMKCVNPEDGTVVLCETIHVH